MPGAGITCFSFMELGGGRWCYGRWLWKLGEREGKGKGTGKGRL